MSRNMPNKQIMRSRGHQWHLDFHIICQLYPSHFTSLIQYREKFWKNKDVETKIKRILTKIDEIEY